jgi:hypothetical protein
MKTFFLPPEAIKPNLAPRCGSCLASDLIRKDHPFPFPLSS